MTIDGMFGRQAGQPRPVTVGSPMMSSDLLKQRLAGTDAALTGRFLDLDHRDLAILQQCRKPLAATEKPGGRGIETQPKRLRYTAIGIGKNLDPGIRGAGRLGPGIANERIVDRQTDNPIHPFAAEIIRRTDETGHMCIRTGSGKRSGKAENRGATLGKIIRADLFRAIFADPKQLSCRECVACRDGHCLSSVNCNGFAPTIGCTAVTDQMVEGQAMRIVILGAGQAAASMAARLRANGHQGPLTVIGAETAAPYQRPPLSKAYLLGEMSLDRLTLRAPDWWREQEINLHLNECARSIDRKNCEIVTDKGRIGYDVLALTLGASPRHLSESIGGTLSGVHVIRNLADVDRLAPELLPRRRLVVIGGGYIGLEAAAVARKLGLDVALVEAAPRILNRVAAAETADLIRDLHRRNGVEIIENAGLPHLTGDERVNGVTLQDGRTLPADVVVTGIGVEPETSLAQKAGLAVDNGVAVDEYGQSSDPAIWAAGDCASFPHQGRRIRLESVGNAIDMAELVADNICGARKPYLAKPWFWSDQFDAKLQIAGLGTGHDHIVTRAGDRPCSGSVWYYSGSQLLAVDALNDPRAYMIGKRLIEAGRSPTSEAISSTTDLKTLLA